MEDWALIRRLVADGVPQRRVARDLGIGRSTVARAVASQVPPRYERRPATLTSFSPFEGRVRALLSEHPEMPATVLAERVGWDGSITWFRDNVRRLRPEHRRPDPADRLTWDPGDAAQCDLWFPPGRILLEDGSSALLPVLVITAAYSRFITGRMIPTRKTEDQLLTEIREQGYPGSMNLLYRYITQGRVEADRPHLSPKRVARLMLTRPTALSDSQRSLLAGLAAACPELTKLATLVSSFAGLLRPDPENETRLKDWIQAARACDLPVVHAFTRGLDLDPLAVTAAVTLPFHNGRTEGVNTRTKMIKRQMYGRAGFTLLRHRILLS